MQILFEKQNGEMIFKFREGRYFNSFTFTNPEELKFFGLQLIKYVENRNEFLCILAYMISDNYKNLSLDISDMFKMDPENLEEKAILSKIYADNKWTYINLSSENRGLLITMDKIVNLVEFLVESCIIGNLEFGDNLFWVCSEDLFDGIIKKDMLDALYDAMERVQKNN